LTDTDDKLLDILSTSLQIDKSEITDDLRRKDFEPWDSMAHLMIITEVEASFEIFFEDEEVTEIWTVGDLKRILAEKLQS
jgi:acyl carrier protein